MKFWAITLFIVGFIGSSIFIFTNTKDDTIKIGLLYSKTGTMANQERAIANMVHLGVEEINQKGGVLNKRVEIVEYDGESDPKVFAKGAESLIDQGINNIFGCWTSASRKAVKPILEEKNALLFYPVQYEGVEKSKNILYLGLTPSQQLKPTLNYIKTNFGDSVYIVGSDYIYPRMSATYINEFAKLIGLDIVGSSFLPLGSINFEEVVRDIKRKKPQAVINLVNGKSNIALFSELQKQNVNSSELPLFSMSLDESNLKEIVKTLGKNSLDGNYATWSYFNSIKSTENSKFKKEVAKRFGKDFTVTDAGYSAYLAVKFFKRAAQAAQSVKPSEILKNIKRDSLNTLIGIVYIDPRNNHLHKQVKIATINSDDFLIVYSSDVLVEPHPYPSFNMKSFWDKQEKKLYKRWDNNWQANSSGGSDE